MHDVPIDTPFTEERLQLAQDILSACIDINDVGHVRMSPFQKSLIPRLLRATSLYEGIYLLASYGLSDEALFLCRALFDESLQNAEFAESSASKRKSLLAWFENNSLEREGDLAQLAIDHKLLTGDLKDREIQMQQARKLKAEERKLLGIHPIRFMKTEKAAVRYSSSEDLWLREMCHQFVHGNVPAFLRRVQVSESGQTFFNRDPGPERPLSVFGFASRSIIRTGRAVAVICQRDTLPFDALTVRLIALQG